MSERCVWRYIHVNTYSLCNADLRNSLLLYYTIMLYHCGMSMNNRDGIYIYVIHTGQRCAGLGSYDGLADPPELRLAGRGLAGGFRSLPPPP